MRSAKLVLFLCLIASISPSLSAQVAMWPPVPPYSNLTAPPVRDAKAEALVQSAITAMGGAGPIGQIQNWQVQAQVIDTANSGKFSGTVLWQQAGLEFRMQSSTASGTSAIVTGHGKPAAIVNGTAKALGGHVTRALFVPVLLGALLLQEFQNPNYSIESSGTSTVNSQSVVIVTIACRTSQTDAMVTPQTWYFSTSSGLPVRVEYRIPSAGGPRLYVAAAHDFSNYQNVSGVLYPFQITSYRLGKQARLTTVQSVNVNTQIAATTFDAPTGGAQ